MAVASLGVAAGGHAAENGGLEASISWNLGLRSTAYVFQTEDPGGAGETHYRGFQHFSGSAAGLAGGPLSFRGSARLANDLHLDPRGFETSKLYSGHLALRVSPDLRVRVGRQFVLGGATSTTLDGAWVGFRPRPAWDLAAWGGARSPGGLAFESGSLDRDAAAGVKVAYRAGPRLRLSAAAAMLEQRGRTASRPLSLEAAATVRPGVKALGRVIYDLETEVWRRLQGQVRWRPRDGRTSVDLQFIDRRPYIDPASWFVRFADVERIRVARASLRYENEARFGGDLEGFGSFVDGRNSSRLGASALFPGGRLGWSVRLGDAAEENRFFGELSRRLLPWLWAEGEASFATYALLKDPTPDQERDLVTLSGRLRARLRSGMRILAEVQSLDNPLYKRDVRFLCGVDLSVGRGAGRYGLDRRRWLR